MSSRLPNPTDIVQVNNFSDGDPNHRPTDPAYVPSNPDNYLRKLATKWMEEKGGGAGAGRVYILDKLPAGYALYERRRVANLEHVCHPEYLPLRCAHLEKLIEDYLQIDRYLFGHPKHQTFDSPNRFYPHFLSLMDHNPDIACSCEVCQKNKFSGNRKPRPNTVGTRGGPPRTARPRKDKDLDEDQDSYFTCLLELLRKEGSLIRAWQEPSNMDWRATRELAAKTLPQIASQPSFVPRVGELVLWCHTIEGEIQQHPQSKEFRFFDPKSGRFGKHPRWLGGVIAQAPVPEEPVGLDDLLTEGEKKKAVPYSGFRVECLPNPNDRDKSLTLQYSHVPMHHIRPMACWKEIMAGTAPDDWHPTIRNCMTALGTISQIERYCFHGTWPTAYVESRGCAYGAEMFFVGDVVRMLHEEGATTITDILHVTDLAWKYEDFRPDHHERVLPRTVSRVHAEFHGHGYTMDINRSRSRVGVDPKADNHGLPEMVYGYGAWYHIFEPDTTMSVSCVGVFGRLYEPDAVQQWFPEMNATAWLNMGYEGIVEAKKNALEWDERMKNPAKPFLICEHRSQGLDITSFNGRSVGSMDDPYDPSLWRRVLAEIDRVPGNTNMEALSARGSMALTSPGRGVGMRSGGMMMSTGVDIVDLEEQADGEDEEGVEGDEGDEDEVLDPVVRGLVHGLEEAAIEDEASNQRGSNEMVDSGSGGESAKDHEHERERERDYEHDQDQDEASDEGRKHKRIRVG